MEHLHTADKYYDGLLLPLITIFFVTELDVPSVNSKLKRIQRLNNFDKLLRG